MERSGGSGRRKMEEQKTMKRRVLAMHETKGEKLPRVYTSLTKRAYKAVEEYSEEQGVSKSRAINDLILEAINARPRKTRTKHERKEGTEQ